VEPIDPGTVLRARGGDPAAFADLVRHYQDAIYGLAYRLTYDRELARDIAQDVFLRLHRSWDKYDTARPFQPWFMTLATNHALNTRAKARRRKALSLDAPLGGDPDGPTIDVEDPDAERADSAAAEGEARRAIRAAIQELPEKYAGVVVLFYLEGLGVKEISARLEMPEGTVKIRLHRARNVLREKLERWKG
jgi:RNA polymerase sigma-70 factor, ECF subfamily